MEYHSQNVMKMESGTRLLGRMGSLDAMVMSLIFILEKLTKQVSLIISRTILKFCSEIELED
jgi:hypothetical protein